MQKIKYVFHTKDSGELRDFSKQSYQLGIVERKAPSEATSFFEKLMKESFEVTTIIRKEFALEDVKKALEGELSARIQKDPLYGVWLRDMSELSQLFCDVQGTDSTGFWLGSNRGCSRYHVDNVPLRMLVTYCGKGTEWVPNDAADRQAFASGQPNEKIVKDKSALEFMNPWDIALFRGGPDGLLHRTPDSALKEPSILLRLDHPTFWEKVLKLVELPH